MLALIARRIGQAIPTLICVLGATFILFHIVPGDPVDILLGEQASTVDRETLRAELGLNTSLPKQFVNFISGLSRGDLGTSFSTKKPVAQLLKERLPATLELGATALFLSTLIGLSTGVLAARFGRSRASKALDTLASLGYSIPGVFLGPALVWLFALKLGLLPVSERGTISHLILPALSLTIPMASYLFRITRSAMLEQWRENYIRTARAKGLSETRVFFKHVLRNALTPILTIIGLQAGAVLTGTLITETVFDWPGLGTLIYTAIGGRDLPLVEGCVLLIAAIYMLTTLITDLAYALSNPYLRQSS